MIGPRLLVTLDRRTGWRPSLSARWADRAAEALEARSDWPRAQDPLPPDPFAETVSMQRAGGPVPRDGASRAGAAARPSPTADAAPSRTVRLLPPEDGGAVPAHATRRDSASSEVRSWDAIPAERSILPTEEGRVPAAPEAGATGPATTPVPEAPSAAPPTKAGAPVGPPGDGEQERLPSTTPPDATPSTSRPFWAALEPGAGPVPLDGIEIRPVGGVAQKRPDVRMTPRPARGSEPPGEPAAEQARPPTGPAPARVWRPVDAPTPTTAPDRRAGPVDDVSTGAAPATPTSPAAAEPSPAGPLPAKEPAPTRTSAADPRLVEAVAHQLRLSAARERERRGEWP